MDNELAKEILSRLDKLGEAATSAGSKTWPALVKAEAVSGWTGLIVGVN